MRGLEAGLKGSDFAQAFNPVADASLTTKRSIDSTQVRAYWESLGLSVARQTISFQMLKGGVSKTTSALNLGIRAAQYGLKVLFVDLDQQANLSQALGVMDETLPVWVDIAEQKVTIEKACQRVSSHIDLIPSSLNNSVLEKVLLKSHRNWALSIRGPLAEIRHKYDWIILDTAPSLSLVNTAATCASQLIVLPVTPDPFAISGVKKHLAELAEIEKDFELIHLKKKILLTRFDTREVLSHRYLDELANSYPEFLLDSFIRLNADVKKSVEEKKSLFQTQSAAKEDYDLLTRELMGFYQGENHAKC